MDKEVKFLDIVDKANASKEFEAERMKLLIDH
jgi:hypothetical protein